jgi:DedD protein
LESLVKERLTGAIILVVLIVLLVPELLSGPSRSAPVPQAAAPSSSSSEEAPLRSYTIDLGNDSRSTAPSPSAGTSNTPPEPNGPAQPSTIVEHPGPDSSPPQQSTDAAPPQGGAWVVQVGVFAKQANAERLARDLQTQGFHALVSENSSGGRTLWWVRAGPVAERAAAEQLSARLRAAGHVGSVVPK